MSQSTKRKHVTKEVTDEFHLPEGDQRIVQVVAGRGNNLHQVLDPAEDEEAQKYLVSMPTKFRKNVWIKRGDYVIVKPIVEGDKVKAEIVQILYKDQVKYIKQEGKWPRFPREEEKASKEQYEKKLFRQNLNSSNGDDDDLFQNTNRPVVEYPESDTSSESGEDAQGNV